MAKKVSNEDFFEKYKAKSKVEEKKEEKREGFFEKIRSDKKYSAKVQLMGWFLFFLILVVGLNVSSNGSHYQGNVVNGGNNSNGSENTSKEKTKLLENLDNNYSYSVVTNLVLNSVNADNGEAVSVEKSISYRGKSYLNTLEIERENTDLYYRVDDNYYSKVDNVTTLVKESNVYEVVEAKYIEIDSIVKLIDKASLDHYTNYSSGKREYVYHLKVKDIILSASSEDVIEISVLEENNILTINVDYSNLYKLIDESVLEFKLEAVIADIGSISEFSVIVNARDDNVEDNSDLESDENTSVE